MPCLLVLRVCECGITTMIVLWFNAPQTLTKGDYPGGPNLITRSLTELPLADERRGHLEAVEGFDMLLLA